MKKILIYAFVLCSLFASAQPALQDTTRFWAFDPVKSFVTTGAGFKLYMFPSQTGNAGKFLQTDGSNMSWATASGGVSDGDKGDISVTASGATWTIDNLAVTNAKVNDVSFAKLTDGTLPTNSIATVTNSSRFRVNFNAGSTGFEVSDVGSSTSIYSEDNTQSVTASDVSVSVLSGGSEWRYIDGVQRNYDSDKTNYIGIQTPATGSLTADYTLTLPVDDGAPDQALVTNGAGVLSWATVGGSGSVATDAIWDAKGDLAVGTGANTAIRLAVGSDASQIYADASTASGLRWGPSVITPSQLTSDQDDYAPTGWANSNIVRLSSDNGMRAITSFAATFSGDKKTLTNVGDFPLYFPGEHPDGTTGNRIITRTDFILFPNESVDIVYDNSDSRWRLNGQQSDPNIGKSLVYNWSYGVATVGDQWFLDINNSGTAAATSSVDATSPYPGHYLLSTGTTTTGSNRLNTTEGGIHFSVFGDAHLYGEWLISIPTLSDGTETFTDIFTIDDTGNNNTLNNNSVGIRYSHGTNSGKWQGFSRSNAGAETTADLGITVVAGTVYKLRVEIDKSRSEARFYINGKMLGRADSNMPNALSSSVRALHLKSAGTTARTLRVHSMNSGAIYP